MKDLINTMSNLGIIGVRWDADRNDYQIALKNGFTFWYFQSEEFKVGAQIVVLNNYPNGGQSVPTDKLYHGAVGTIESLEGPFITVRFSEPINGHIDSNFQREELGLIK